MQPILLFCFFLSVYSLAVEQRSCVSSAVVDVSRKVSLPHYFCAWYLKDGRTSSPISGINVDALLSACRCITSIEPAGTKAKNLAAIGQAARLQSPVSATCPSTPANPISKQFTDSISFCRFFGSFERYDSPIPNMNVPAVRKACKCILSSPKTSSSTTAKSPSKSSTSSGRSSKATSSSIASQPTSKSMLSRTSSTTVKSSSKTSSKKTTSSRALTTPRMSSSRIQTSSTNASPKTSSTTTKISATPIISLRTSRTSTADKSSSISRSSSRLSSVTRSPPLVSPSGVSSPTKLSSKSSLSSISSSKKSLSSQSVCVFSQRTVTTLASPITITSLRTVTLSVPTTTAIQLSTTTLLITEVAGVAYTLTGVVNNTSYETVFSQETMTNLHTSVASITETVTSVSTTPVYLFSPKPEPTPIKRDEELGVRAAVSGCPDKALVTTTTLSAATATTVSTIYITPPVVTLSQTSHMIVNATRVVISSQQMNITITSVISTTVTSTLQPATVDSTVTQTSTSTVTATSFVAGPTQWCQMNLRASGGVVDGRYMANDVSHGVAVISFPESQLKDAYQLDNDGHVVDTTGSAAGQTWTYYYRGGSYVYPRTAAQLAQYSANYILHVCSVNGDTLEFFCHKQASGNSNLRTYIWMNGYTREVGQYLWLDYSLNSGATQFRMYAEPINCVT